MLRFSVFILAIATYSCATHAQTLPDYPAFQLVGQIGGNPNTSTFNSSAEGILTANANTYGSFHYIALSSKWDVSKLSFKISCVYINGADQLVTTPTYSDGQNCPQATGQSRFIRAIKLQLDGPNKQDYDLRYSCKIGYFQQNTLTDFGEVAAGQWCGHTEGGAPKEWLAQIVVKLRRN